MHVDLSPDEVEEIKRALEAQLWSHYAVIRAAKQDPDAKSNLEIQMYCIQVEGRIKLIKGLKEKLNAD